MPKIGTLIGDRYELGKPLGEGGMGAVFRAIDRHTSRPVALKLLQPDVAKDPQQVERFRREFAVLQGLDHPSLVRLLDGSFTGEEPFLVFDVIEGESLEAVMQRGALTVARALELSIQLSEAVGVLHAHQILHRDLKPSNVMVRKTGTICLLDFGIAKHFGDAQRTMDRVTQEGFVVGTPQYMPPEALFTVAAITPAYDVYSLGVLFYEMFAGRRPFAEHEDSIVKLAAAVTGGDFAPAASHRPGVPRALDTLLARCLAVDPADRPADAAELALALSELEHMTSNSAAALPVPNGLSSNGRATGKRPVTGAVARPTGRSPATGVAVAQVANGTGTAQISRLATPTGATAAIRRSRPVPVPVPAAAPAPAPRPASRAALLAGGVVLAALVGGLALHAARGVLGPGDGAPSGSASAAPGPRLPGNQSPLDAVAPSASAVEGPPTSPAAARLRGLLRKAADVPAPPVNGLAEFVAKSVREHDGLDRQASVRAALRTRGLDGVLADLLAGPEEPAAVLDTPADKENWLNIGWIALLEHALALHKVAWPYPRSLAAQVETAWPILVDVPPTDDTYRTALTLVMDADQKRDQHFAEDVKPIGVRPYTAYYEVPIKTTPSEARLWTASSGLDRYSAAVMQLDDHRPVLLYTTQPVGPHPPLSITYESLQGVLGGDYDRTDRRRWIVMLFATDRRYLARDVPRTWLAPPRVKLTVTVVDLKTPLSPVDTASVWAKAISYR